VVFGVEPTKFVYTLSYKFENRGTTSIELTNEDVSIPLFMNTSWQTVNLDDIDKEYSITILDKDGNLGAIVKIDKLLLPGQEESFTVTYSISSFEQKRPIYKLDDALGYEMIPKNLDIYTKPTETFPADNPKFKETALSIINGKETVLGTVIALVEYIMENTTYSNFEIPQYPSKTLKTQLGDCDDQSILLITICRSLNIPAYMQVGIYINPAINDKDVNWDGHLINYADGVGWHGWAMIFIPPWGWVPVDLTLTNSNSGIELIRNAPEYDSILIPVLNISEQSYIGNAIAARDRVTNSSIYVTISDKADIIYNGNDPLQNYVLLGLSISLLIAIGLMFRYSGR
jgi:transglutaminase-like putative cysteine protease